MISFNKQKRIHPCYLTKDDLETLVSLVKSDFPESDRQEDFTISTNSNELNISEHSVQNFLNHNRLPPILTRLDIRMIGWSVDSIDKSINITFYDNFISLRVSGTSETWVQGKYLQVTEFLKTKRPVLWFLETPPVYMFRGALLLVIAGLSGYMLVEIYKNGINSAGMAPLIVFFCMLLDFAISKFAYTRIFLKEQKTFIEKYNGAILLIGALGSLIGIISFIADLFN